MRAEWTTPLCLLMVAAACGPDVDIATNEPGWTEFLAQSTKHVDGRDIYIVEWDLPIASIEELHDYYLRNFAGDDGLSETEDPLLVNVVGGADDLWQGPAKTHLSYCVTDDFGSNHSRVVSEMRGATSAWARLANVAFRYNPNEDASCTGGNTAVTFAVRPWSEGGACSFFPSGDGCVARTLVIDIADFDTNPDWDELAPNITTEGVFRHELGHVLGFRHEHINPASGAASCIAREDTSWRAVTEYDASSVMHYQWCNGVLTSDLRLTDRDERGSVTLYGLATPAMTAALIY